MSAMDGFICGGVGAIVGYLLCVAVQDRYNRWRTQRRIRERSSGWIAFHPDPPRGDRRK